MSRGIAARTAVPAAALAAAGALVLSMVSMAPPAGATKPLSAPVFSGKSLAKGKQGTPLNFTVKTKANPTATLSVTTPLPPGVSFHNNGNGTGTLSDPTPLGGTYTIGLQATNTTSQVNVVDQTLTLFVKSKLPPIRHVFVIMLENQGYAATFGAPSVDPYLATTLPGQGALLSEYDGIGHFSNDNYAAFLSGQPPNATNQLDCSGTYPEFLPVPLSSTASNRGPAACTHRR